MKTLCINSWGGFIEGQSYDVVVGSSMFVYGINTLTYDVYYSQTIITQFQDGDMFGKNYNKHFSHKLYQRTKKLERLVNDNI